MSGKDKSRSTSQSLLAKYRAALRAVKNIDRSGKDHRNAERKFLKYAVEQRRIEIEEELFR
jgi:hypothetical protein